VSPSRTTPVKSAAAEALADMVQAVNAINLEAPVGEVETKLDALAAQLAEVRRHVRKTYPSRNGNGHAPHLAEMKA
jgi:hypothetical protein